MTIVFSIAEYPLIIMSVDSAVTRVFENGTLEFDVGRKAYPISGIGCVTTWGERDGNTIGRFLDSKSYNPADQDVTDLAKDVFTFLRDEYRPHELEIGDVGFHIGGFDKSGAPRLYHAFWGFDRPRSSDQNMPHYVLNDHSPTIDKFQILFNGRNDLAFTIIQTLIEQINQGKPVRYNMNNLFDLVKFSDFVIRFGAEITPEVGPPFITYLISPRNGIADIVNEYFSPIETSKVIEVFRALSYVVHKKG